MSDLLEIKVGRTYWAKRPRPAGTTISPLVNDRTVTGSAGHTSSMTARPFRLGGITPQSPSRSFAHGLLTM